MKEQGKDKEKMMKIVSLLLVLITCSASGYASVYQWTDKKGNIHFSDKPSDEHTLKELTLPNKNNNIEFTKPVENNWQVDYKKNKKIKAKLDEKQELKNKNDKNICNYYSSRLQSYKQYGRIVNMSPEGKRTYLTDEQRLAKIKLLGKKVSKYCYR